MPVHGGQDNRGLYYQWGHHGTKYYYSTPESQRRARDKAMRQGRAAYAGGYVGKNF